MTYIGYYEDKVRSILNTAVAAVPADPSRRFIWEETSYLSLWWDDARTTDEQRAQFTSLLEAGRLELVGGGWVMHDEACTSADHILEQMAFGRQWLNSTFGGITT